MEKIKFILDGCDIQLLAEAPKDITLEQLLKQCDKIVPAWCACGICSYNPEEYKDCDGKEYWLTDVIIDYDSIKKGHENANCRIEEEECKRGE